MSGHDDGSACANYWPESPQSFSDHLPESLSSLYSLPLVAGCLSDSGGEIIEVWFLSCLSDDLECFCPILRSIELMRIEVKIYKTMENNQLYLHFSTERPPGSRLFARFTWLAVPSNGHLEQTRHQLGQLVRLMGSRQKLNHQRWGGFN